MLLESVHSAKEDVAHQYPFLEQQLPNFDVRQVYLDVPPHVASVDTFPDEFEGVVGAETGGDEAGFVGAATGALGGETTTPPAEGRYQFASGSPRHSPTVTALNPCCCKF